MARILFCEFSNVTWLDNDIWDAHAEGFINSLVREGNEVLGVLTNKLLVDFLSLDLRYGVIENRNIKKIISKFNPELIITYNNSLPGIGLLQYTNCPIIVYPADVITSWAGIDVIKKNLDRYYFFESTIKITQSIKKAFPDISPSHFIPFGYVTDVRAIDIKQDINISFVGSISNYSHDIVQYFTSLSNRVDVATANQVKDDFLDYFHNFNNDTLTDSEWFGFPYAIGKNEAELKMRGAWETICLSACNKRYEILCQLKDMGLQVFGPSGAWAGVMLYDVELFSCFNYRTSVTLEHSINTYNRSKVSLNLPQGTKTDGFSWRVCDILASNAVLVSVRKKDLENLMAPYYQLPYYASAAEARELVEKLLKEPNWRKEIVEASQKMIDENCRYELKFKNIEDAIGNLNLYGENVGGGVKYEMKMDEALKPFYNMQGLLSKDYWLFRVGASIYRFFLG